MPFSRDAIEKFKEDVDSGLTYFLEPQINNGIKTQGIVVNVFPVKTGSDACSERIFFIDNKQFSYYLFNTFTAYILIVKAYNYPGIINLRASTVDANFTIIDKDESRNLEHRLESLHRLVTTISLLTLHLQATEKLFFTFEFDERIPINPPNQGNSSLER